MSLWFAHARLAQEMAFTSASAALVIASRMTTMATEGAAPSAAGRREAERMVTEKAFAAFDGTTAAMRMMGQMAVAGTLYEPDAALRLTRAAIRPGSRAVRANARRLTKA